MHTISKKISFDAAHRLLHHHGKCHNVHGHTYHVTITLAGKVTSKGMIKDFAELKWIKEWIDTHFDHGYIHHPDDPYIKYFQADGLKTFNLGDEPTAENIAKFLFELIHKKEPLLSSIEVDETPTSKASYVIDR